MLRWLFGCRACDYTVRTARDDFAQIARAIPARYRKPEGEPIVDMVKRVVAIADGQTTDRHNAQCELASARNDVQALNARAAEDAKRIAKAAELLDDQREKNESLWVEWQAAEAELAALRTLIGNARNQLDGRKHYPEDEPACVGA